MKFNTLANVTWKVAAGVALVMGAVTQANATPTFQIDPTVLGGPAGFGPGGTNIVTADFINGNASTLLTLFPATDTTAGAGFINFTSFALNNVAQINTSVPNAPSGFEVFATFSYTTKLTSGAGTLGALGSTYDVTSLSFNLYGDNLATGTKPVFTAATAGGASGSAATVALGSAVLLGQGTLATTGHADINGGGGTSFTTTEAFGLTAFGSTFFTSPVPFYSLAFNSFTNTAPGVTRSGDSNHLAINNASGGVDFNKAPTVPEPASLALVGIALLGCAGIVRRRRQG